MNTPLIAFEAGLHVKVFKYKVVKVEPIEALAQYAEHRRLRVFLNKGTKCVSCGKVGDRIVWGEDRGKYIHKDVCTEDYYPLTIDHVVARSNGGSDDLTNLQPMCTGCNGAKSKVENPQRMAANPDGKRSRRKQKRKLRKAKKQLEAAAALHDPVEL